MKILEMEYDEAEVLYSEHKGKDFFDALIGFSISGPVVAIVVAGYGDVAGDVRKFIGKKDAVGTIRGDFSVSRTNRNIIHASDSHSRASREIDIFFSPNEIIDPEYMDGVQHRYSDKDFLDSKKGK